MGKKLRYIILSFSVVLAIFVFALLWQVRPEFDSSVLDDARERQNAQLVNVNQPLETSADARADEEALIRTVVERVEGDEQFVSSLSSDIEESIKAYVDSIVVDPPTAEAVAEKVLEIVLSDEDVESRIASYVDQAISAKEAEYAEYIDNAIKEINTAVVSDVEAVAVRNEIEKYVSENLPYANDIIDERIQSYVDANIGYIDTAVNDGINTYVNENLPYAEDIIDSRINLYVEENLPYVDQIIDDRIQSYVDANIGYIDTAVNDGINTYVNENLPYAEDIIDSRINLYVEENLPYVDQIIDDRINNYVNENMVYVDDIIDGRIQSYVDTNIGYIDTAVSDGINTYVNENLPYAEDIIDNRINLYVEENLSYADPIIDERINNYVNGNIEALDAIVSQVVDEYYAANKDVINEAASAYVASSLLAASGDNSGSTVYDEVVYNVASDIAGAFAGEDAKRYGDLSSYEDSVLTTIENIVLEVLNRLDEYVLVSDTPSESSYVDEGEGIIDQEPVRIIKNPTFSFDDSSSMANQSREDVRRAAIRSVLDSLNR
ncbi:MAG TPA: hypothetical protein IAA76_01290 [Candidatus Ornithospirochaeta stercorigallinarum]|nr:hypothetical protein [Candidatus Ornithospirochaeta stercorigallinarum]